MTQPARTDEERKESVSSDEEKPEEEPKEGRKSGDDVEDTCVYVAGERTKSGKTEVGVIVGREKEGRIEEVKERRIDEVKEIVKAEVVKTGSEEDDNVPPALPPRPPPRPRQQCTCTCVLDDRGGEERNERRVPRYCWANGLRKYVFLCTACGSLSILLGALFLIVYFMLKSYTSSLNHFETIPTYVPSGMLIATGFLIICLACRKNRNSFLMKLCGLCSLCCAVLCVSVTVTTTVIHMNRLQTLRECLYTLKTQSCTCYSVLMDNDRISDEGIKFVFNSTPDCEVIHGALYSCLRAIFGLSVIGILVCIFSCMLVYQLLSHEKKKMYWAQLEMRCRYLYRQQRNPHYYSCCDECRYPPHPHELFPWDLMGNRFWSTGRIGNLYTPNPEDRGNASRLRSGWNWRRLPWSRTGANSAEPTRANLGSPDSQYGFSSTPTVDGTPYTVLDPRTPPVIPPCHPVMPPAADMTEGGFYSWGPPPPYASNRNSANNSPARRSLGEILHQVSPIRRNDNVSPARNAHHVHRHHLHHNRQCGTSRQAPNTNTVDAFQKQTPARTTPITNAIQQQQSDPLWTNSLSSAHRLHKPVNPKTNYENMYPSDTLLPSDGFNTLPSLKRRTHPRAPDIFHDDTSTAYFFSSPENLTSNLKIDTDSENLPPRIFLTSHPNSSRYPPPSQDSFTTPNSHNFSFKTPTDVAVSDSPMQQPTDSGEDGRHRNASLVRKLLVNCSPSKQKPGGFSGIEKGESHTPRKKTNKKLEPTVGVEEGDHVITFHYRVGIPRSPDVQNLSQLVGDKRVQEGSDGGKDKAEVDVEKKSTKYMAKDVELLQKHGSLIREFQRNLDSQKKYRSDPGKDKPRRSPESEDFHPKHNETESDVYFGDISNSSCYMSLQNDTLDLYEDAPRFPNPILNKQNLKMMENETSHYSQTPDSKHRHRKFYQEDAPEDEHKPEYKKSPRRGYHHDSKLKYLPYHQESNDEHSSGSVTADSGISTGRTFIPKCFDTAPEGSRGDDAPLDFSHPLFQKPKILPRTTRNESRQKKQDEPEEEVECKRKRAGKGSQGGFMEDAHLPPLPEPNPPPQDEGFPSGKSPKPLPRTTVKGDGGGEWMGKVGRYKEKGGQFIAPDAQYEAEGKQKVVVGRMKPAVPVRGDLEKKVEGVKMRGKRLGESGEGVEMGSHSVNV